MADGFYARMWVRGCVIVCALFCLSVPVFVHAQSVATGTVDVSATVPGEDEEEEEEEPPSGGGSPGSGAPSDIQPPLIFNIRQVIRSSTQAVIFWQTDEAANTVMDYGLDAPTAATTRVQSPVRTLVHEIALSGLLPCTGYRYQLFATDADGNTGSAGWFVLSMPCDTDAPLVEGLQIVDITDHSAVAVWTTDEPSTSLVEYGQTTAYGSRSSLPGYVTVHAVPLAGLFPDTLYHVRARSVDPSGNEITTQDVTFRTLGDATPPVNVGLLAEAGDRMVRLQWRLPEAREGIVGVRIVRREGGFPEGPMDGVVIFDAFGDAVNDTGLRNHVRYFYAAYAYDAAGLFSSGSFASAVPFAAEESGDAPDDEASLPPLFTEEPAPEEEGALPVYVRLFGAGGALALSEDENGRVGVLAGSSFLVRIQPDVPGVVLEEAFAMLEHEIYPIPLTARGFEVGLVAPEEIGLFVLRVRVRFSDGRIAERPLLIQTIAPGYVFIRPLIGPAQVPIAGAVVTLFRFNGSDWDVWDGGVYGQENPRITNDLGSYAFLVPPGLYAAEVLKQGYLLYRTSPLFVDENVFAVPVKLVSIPVDAPLPDDASLLDRFLHGVSGVFGQMGFLIRRFGAFSERSDVRPFLNWLAVALAALAVLNVLQPLARLRQAFVGEGGAIPSLSVLRRTYVFVAPFLGAFLLWFGGAAFALPALLVDVAALVFFIVLLRRDSL